MKIRPAAATVEDMAAIRALSYELDVIEQKNQPEHFTIVERTDDMLLKFINDPKADYLVAEHGGQIMGFMLLHEKEVETGSSLIPHKYAYAYELIVSPKAHRSGYGKALLEAAKNWAKARKLPFLRLSVLPKNQKAYEFYANHGMETALIDMEYKF